MDLVAGVKKIFVITQHNTKKGLPKILDKCTFPLTGKNSLIKFSCWDFFKHNSNIFITKIYTNV